MIERLVKISRVSDKPFTYGPLVIAYLKSVLGLHTMAEFSGRDKKTFESMGIYIDALNVKGEQKRLLVRSILIICFDNLNGS